MHIEKAVKSHGNRGCMWNEMRHLYSTLLYCTPLQSYQGVSPHPSPVSSIHLYDVTAATEHQCAHNTSYWWGACESMRIIIRRLWLIKANGGNFSRKTGLPPWGCICVFHMWTFERHTVYDMWHEKAHDAQCFSSLIQSVLWSATSK